MANFNRIFSAAAITAAAWTFPQGAQAAISHDFRLSPNSKIEARCRTSNGDASSKIKVYVRGAGSLAMDLKACTTGYGFQEINATVTIPALLLDVDKMKEVAVGSSVSSGGQRATRKADSGDKMNFAVTGINPRVAVLNIQVPTTEGWARAIRGGSRIQIPWSAISFQYRHALAGTFDFNGRLNEIQSE